MSSLVPGGHAQPREMKGGPPGSAPAAPGAGPTGFLFTSRLKAQEVGNLEANRAPRPGPNVTFW